MYKLKLTAGYAPKLSQRVTEKAIKQVKDEFQRIFSAALGLERISAPVMVRAGSGINDDLNGVERPVRFDVPEAGFDVEIVHSLAKWKRMALHQYGFA
ncbi:MAG: aspartate--ammonia ligase, partial [Clostridiales bacterium]|nr:aspartate--ammonia ligase [Clostridiales bacterium]